MLFQQVISGQGPARYHGQLQEHRPQGLPVTSQHQPAAHAQDAYGPQGAQGACGPQGAQGACGPQGVQVQSAWDHSSGMYDGMYMPEAGPYGAQAPYMAPWDQSAAIQAGCWANGELIHAHGPAPGPHGRVHGSQQSGVQQGPRGQGAMHQAGGVPLPQGQNMGYNPNLANGSHTPRGQHMGYGQHLHHGTQTAQEHHSNLHGAQRRLFQDQNRP